MPSSDDLAEENGHPVGARHDLVVPRRRLAHREHHRRAPTVAQPITEFCDKNCLPTRDRLALFEQAWRAVQHAHQKGIIHRDIKPSNVLVALYDGKPVPKVIAFGVAKAIAEPLTDKTLYTRHGQVVGTFGYLSPEQATLDQLDIDMRSDVYALGVVLYELLTGTPPLDKGRLWQAGFARSCA